MKKVLTATAVVLSVTAMAAPAQAGGLFGKGGLFRGTIGNALDRHVEKPITTRIARAATVGAGAAVGGTLGAAVGAPVTGALIGAGVGQAANDVVAGKH